MPFTLPCDEIWVSQQPVDFRCAVDGLCGYVHQYFGASPQQGLYIFYNRARNRLKMLMWHHNGFLLIYKRLERGRFPFCFSPAAGKHLITDKQLQGLLLGIDWQSISTWDGIQFENYY